ncbi:hypothetical protein ACQ4PT_006135 [Festuca glaucescens]
MDPEPFRATAGQLRALPNWRKRPIIRGPGIEGEYEFEAFIEFANRVKLSYGDFDALERLVAKHVPRIPMRNIPASYLSNSSGNLVISELIADIQKQKASNDDFVRKAVLVLIGTVLAPYGPRTIDRNHYCLVEDVPRIFKINWNHFTLRYLIDNLTAATRAPKTRGWPKGNLGLTQFLYWEKVVVVDDSTYIPHKSIRPLMKNWTEAEAEMRSIYDYANGRGRGKVKDVLKMLNKNGVMYKPAEGSESDKGGDEEENDSIHNEDSFRKEFMYKTSSDKIDALISNLTKNSDAALRDDLFAEDKYVTPAKHNGV